VLGSGGYSVVKAGHSLVSEEKDRKVAIKIVSRKKLLNESNVRGEVEILRELSHPNILQVYDFLEDTDHFYLILERLEGGELFDRIVKRQSYTEKDARDVIRIVLNALKYCHDNNVVHR
jgi:serine/threonine protein kinase